MEIWMNYCFRMSPVKLANLSTKMRKVQRKYRYAIISLISRDNVKCNNKQLIFFKFFFARCELSLIDRGSCVYFSNSQSRHMAFLEECYPLSDKSNTVSIIIITHFYIVKQKRDGGTIQHQ